MAVASVMRMTSMVVLILVVRMIMTGMVVGRMIVRRMIVSRMVVRRVIVLDGLRFRRVIVLQRNRISARSLVDGKEKRRTP